MGISQSKSVFSTLVIRLKDGLIDEMDSAFWDEFWKTTLTAEVSDSVFPCCLYCKHIDLYMPLLL